MARIPGGRGYRTGPDFTVNQQETEYLRRKIQDIENSVGFKALGAVTFEPTGFPNRTDSAISFNVSSRTFSIAPTGTSFDFYIRGVKFSKRAAQTVTIPNTTGKHFIYFDSTGKLVSSTTAWSFSGELVMVAIVYWRASGSDYLLLEERHGCTMDWATHSYLHSTVNTRYGSGLAGSFNAANTFTVATGTIYDEDIQHSIAEQTSARVFYRAGSAWIFRPAGTGWFYTDTGIVTYDSGTGTPVQIASGSHVAYWIFASNDTQYPIWSFMGQRTDTTLAAALANNTPASLSFNDLPAAELKLLYRVIVKNTAGTESVEDVTDYRSVSNLPAIGFTATDHGTLTGLTDDDHTQYALLAGRSGGQTLDLGIGTGAKLRIYNNAGSTTSQAGLGVDFNSAFELNLYFAANAGSGHLSIGPWNGTTFTERMRVQENGNVGIGKTPSYPLDVEGTIRGTGDIYLLKGTSPFIGSTDTQDLRLGTNTTERMRINSTGVGIGRTPAANKLEVAGSISTHSGSFIDDGTTLTVPDYVFEPDYPLMPLVELRDAITDTKHLPGVPDESDRTGWAALSMQDRDMLLLRKVEELTLYILRQQEQIDALKAKLPQ